MLKADSNSKRIRRNIFSTALSISSLVLLTACGPSNVASNASSDTGNAMTNQSSPSPTVSTAGLPSPAGVPVDPSFNNVLDGQLVLKGAQDNLFEIQAGQLATQKASNSAVKQFAQTMVREHTRAGQFIQQAASSRNISLPTDMGEQNRALLDRLSGLSGAEFDREYMNTMVNSHRMDIALLQNQAQQGQDRELKTLAAQKLPALQRHLEMAETLLQQLR